MGEELTVFFSTTSALKTRILHRNTEDSWKRFSAVPWQHIESKPHDVGLPTNSLGDTVPVSGEPKGCQKCRFTGSCGNKIHFPQVSGWDFASGPFLGSHGRKVWLYVIILVLPHFFYIPLVTSGGPQGDGVLISLSHPIILKKLITGFSP